jgi:queuine tRNA-ribosyltransferase
VVDTPGYVAVATNAALKHLDHRLTDYKHVGAEDPQAQQQQAAEGAIADADADASRREIIRGNGQQLMFCNTYHLLLQPGPEVVSEAGGLHHFMNRRDQPLITDSGGFQVFSLANHSVTDELNRKNNQKKYPKSMLKVSEEGVVFRSYRDGTKVQLTPESSVEAQKKLGADLIIPLDELPPFHTSTRELVKSVGMTHRWEARSLMTHLSNINQQAMLGVIHGGIDASLRRWSANYIKSLPFDGFAIGGSLGRNQQELMSILDVVMPQLSDEVGNGRKPVHLLGVGDEQSIRSAVTRGLDTFDSCFPTRIGRHGAALTREGRLNITNRRFKTQHNQVIDPECDCAVCQNGNGFSLAYLHHLFKAKEPLGHQVLAMHNLRYMSDLMARIRDDILNDRI